MRRSQSEEFFIFWIELFGSFQKIFHDQIRELTSNAVDVFSPAMIDGIIKQLRSYNDRTLRQEIEGKEMMMEKLVRQYFHCG